jgi:hypothetical protein
MLEVEKVDSRVVGDTLGSLLKVREDVEAVADSRLGEVVDEALATVS